MIHFSNFFQTVLTVSQNWIILVICVKLALTGEHCTYKIKSQTSQTSLNNYIANGSLLRAFPISLKLRNHKFFYHFSTIDTHNQTLTHIVHFTMLLMYLTLITRVSLLLAFIFDFGEFAVPMLTFIIVPNYTRLSVLFRNFSSQTHRRLLFFFQLLHYTLSFSWIAPTTNPMRVCTQAWSLANADMSMWTCRFHSKVALRRKLCSIYRSMFCTIMLRE